MRTPKCPVCGKYMAATKKWISGKCFIDFNCLICGYKLPKPSKYDSERKVIKSRMGNNS